MKPIQHAACNTRLMPAPGTEDVVAPLPILRDGKGVVSFWTPTKEELALLNQGGAVAMRAWSPSHPAVSLYVVDAEGAKPTRIGPPISKVSHVRGIGQAMAFAFDTESKPGFAIIHSVQFKTIELPNDEGFDATTFTMIHSDNDPRLDHFRQCFVD